MPVISGLSTSTGVSALLNAKREALGNTQAAPGEPARDEAARRAEGAPNERRDRLVRRPVFAPPKGEKPAPSGRERGADSSRHTKFMLAVQALRLDYNEVDLSTPQVAEMMKAAREIFMADDGIPHQVTANYPAGLSEKFKAQEIDQSAELKRAARQERAAEEERAEAARVEAEERRVRAEAVQEQIRVKPRVEQPKPDAPEVAPERPAASSIEETALADLPRPGEAIPGSDDGAERRRLNEGGPRDARFVDTATPSEAPESPGALDLPEGAAPPPTAGTDAALRAEASAPPPPAGTTQAPEPTAGTDAALRAEATAPPPPAGTTQAPEPTAGTDAALRAEATAPPPPAGTTQAPEPTAGTDAALRAEATAPPPPAGTTNAPEPTAGTDAALQSQGSSASAEDAPESAPPGASERAAEARRLESA